MNRVLALGLVFTGCTVLADFPAERMIERTDALCFNGVDDDGDGLTDCQDWKCLRRAACCTRPSVILEDSFESARCAAESCDMEERSCAPDLDRWQRWGAPYPYECEGALRIGKPESACYPVGILSRSPFWIERGLVIEAVVAGVPEQSGRLQIGLTRQATVIDTVEPCAATAPVPTLVGLVYQAAPDGARFTATVADVPVAETIIAASSGTGNDQIAKAYNVSITITDDLMVTLAVNGATVVTTTDAFSAARPVEARLVVSGTGTVARVERVRVVSGTQCEAPSAWAPTRSPNPVDPPADQATWDAFERRAPNASLDTNAQIHLRYVGCTTSDNVACMPSSLSIGEAIASLGSPLVHADAPLIATEAFGSPQVLDISVDEIDHRGYIGLDDDGDTRIRTCTMSGDAAAIAGSVSVLLDEAPSGAWDAGALCCPSIVSRDGDRRLYYAGKAAGKRTWHIGLAISRAGGPFERIGAVLDPGRAGSFDEYGASQPSVIYDEARRMYRMWYRATGAFGATSIGYAVSPDGVIWHRDPSNPVLTPEQLGLANLGSPSVIDHAAGLRMWIDGLAPGEVGRRIYELENLGVSFSAL